MKFSNRELLDKIDRYVADRLECSMGQVEEELKIPLWKQREIYRAYRDYYPKLQLSDGRWKCNLRALASIPPTSQETLSEDR